MLGMSSMESQRMCDAQQMGALVAYPHTGRANTCVAVTHVGAGDLRKGFALWHRRVTGLRLEQRHTERVLCQVRRQPDKRLRAARMLAHPQLPGNEFHSTMHQPSDQLTGPGSAG